MVLVLSTYIPNPQGRIYDFEKAHPPPKKKDPPLTPLDITLNVVKIIGKGF